MIVVMVCPPLIYLEDGEAFACLAVAAIVSDGRFAAAPMQAPLITNLRRDRPALVVVSLLMGSPPIAPRLEATTGIALT
jgi:hypothetical protein